MAAGACKADMTLESWLKGSLITLEHEQDLLPLAFVGPARLTACQATRTPTLFLLRQKQLFELQV